MCSCNCLDNLKYLQNLATLSPFKYLIQNSGILLKEFNINADLFFLEYKLKMTPKQKFFPDDSLIEIEQPKKPMNSCFPDLVQNLPGKAVITIIQLGNIKINNNWMAIAVEIWPDYSFLDIRRYFEEGKMQSILDKWGSEGATTSQLFEILIKVGRKDIIIALQKNYPFVR
jgi:hypothetical protein